jgi:hypothetical protein
MESLVGKKFGELTVLEEGYRHYPSGKLKQLRVLCECGVEKWLSRSVVITGKHTHCRVKSHASNFENLTGYKFGFLTVLEYNWDTKRWICECICGKNHSVRIDGLKTGAVKSCGCKSGELVSIALRKLHPEDNYRAKSKVFRTYKRSAEIKNLLFEMTQEEFFKLIQSNCTYCGSLPRRNFIDADKKVRNPITGFFYNGVDRIDNSKGYTMDNCAPCCFICNYSKRGMNVDEWLQWVDEISTFRYKLIHAK